MSRFFNQKEEVIQIELTSYGKSKLANGEFNPAFYAFYDDGVVYDGMFAGIVETQNDVVDRIVETPRLTPQTRFTSSAGQNSTIGLEVQEYDSLTTANSKFFKVLGDSAPWASNIPAWQIYNLSGSNGFSGSVQYKSEMSIPKFSSNLEINYTISLGDNEEEISTLVGNDKILLDIKELNTVFKNNENFEIEVFKVEDSGNGRLIPLKFLNEATENATYLALQRDPFIFKNGLAPNEEEINLEYPTLDSSYVDYYLTIRVDDEIEDIPRISKTSLYAGKEDSLPNAICEDE